MAQPRTRARLGVACALAVLSGLGLTGCENPGKAAAEAVTQPSKSSQHHRAKGPTKRAAQAFLRKTFVLYEHGRSRRACSFSESKAYLDVDRNCVGEASRTAAQFHNVGASVVPTTITAHLHHTSGKATLVWEANGRRLTTFVYLRFDGHRWWMTGDQQTGDQGL